MVGNFTPNIFWRGWFPDLNLRLVAFGGRHFQIIKIPSYPSFSLDYVRTLSVLENPVPSLDVIQILILHCTHVLLWILICNGFVRPNAGNWSWKLWNFIRPKFNVASKLREEIRSLNFSLTASSPLTHISLDCKKITELGRIQLQIALLFQRPHYTSLFSNKIQHPIPILKG